MKMSKKLLLQFIKSQIVINQLALCKHVSRTYGYWKTYGSPFFHLPRNREWGVGAAEIDTLSDRANTEAG